MLLDKLDDQDERDWYAAQAAEHGWSRNVLLNQIISHLHQRIGSAPSNFARQLPSPDSELVQEITKDPYVFEFLEISAQAHKRDLEQALMERLQQVLLELGRGFAFVGRQVHLDVDGEDFYLDLLLFHVTQLWARSKPGSFTIWPASTQAMS
ncbi:MAG: PDDEXK nuclease domain-containing protein [Nocardioides sp.]